MKLAHDNDPLEGEEKILSNVEIEISRHSEQFKELDILLKWIKVGIAKCTCGFIVRRQDLRYYIDHDNGLDVPFEDTKCWIYSHCPKCGNDYNFQKILRQFQYWKEHA